MIIQQTPWNSERCWSSQGVSSCRQLVWGHLSWAGRWYPKPTLRSLPALQTQPRAYMRGPSGQVNQDVISVIKGHRILRSWPLLAVLPFLHLQGPPQKGASVPHPLLTVHGACKWRPKEVWGAEPMTRVCNRRQGWDGLVREAPGGGKKIRWKGVGIIQERPVTAAPGEWHGQT